MHPIQNELFFQCKICRNEMNEDNYPVSLSCGNTLCLKCFRKMNSSNSKCFFKKDHHHIGQPELKNRILLDIISKANPKKENNKESNSYLNIIKPINDKEYQTDKFTYKGKVIDNKPYGHGELIYKGIGIFTGEFNGQFDKGKGTIKYEDLSSYEGEWENFKRQNYGILKFTNFDRYEGEFKDDLYEGKGKLFLSDRGICYEGFWRDGKKFGEFNIYNELDELIKKENYDNDIKL